MSQTSIYDRLAVKTPEAAFLQVMEMGFGFAPRIASELLNTAQEMLIGVFDKLKVSQ